MTPSSLAALIDGMDDLEEREVLIGKILGELSVTEIVDALAYLWDRREPESWSADQRRYLQPGKTVGERCAEAVAEYEAEVKEIDARAADDEGLA